MKNKVVVSLLAMVVWAFCLEKTTNKLLIAWGDDGLFSSFKEKSGSLVYLGNMESSGKFRSAISNINFTRDSTGFQYRDYSADSVPLISYLSEIRNISWRSDHGRVVSTSGKPQIIAGGELTDCIESINFIHLGKWDSLVTTEEKYFFSDAILRPTPVESSIDSTHPIDSLTPLDSQTLAQIDEFENEYYKVPELHVGKPKGVVYEFTKYGIKDYHFNRNDCEVSSAESEGERVLLINGKKVWPPRNYYFYISHASGGSIQCFTERYSSWYLWQDMLFCITFQFQAHSVSCFVLVVRDGEFSSYEVFNYSPDCG